MESTLYVRYSISDHVALLSLLKRYPRSEQAISAANVMFEAVRRDSYAVLLMDIWRPIFDFEMNCGDPELTALANDLLTRQFGGATSFQALLTAFGTYTPTLSHRSYFCRLLAKRYDAAQAARGDSRRACCLVWMLSAEEL